MKNTPLSGCAASPLSRLAAQCGVGDDANGLAKPVPRRPRAKALGCTPRSGRLA